MQLTRILSAQIKNYPLNRASRIFCGSEQETLQYSCFLPFLLRMQLLRNIITDLQQSYRSWINI